MKSNNTISLLLIGVGPHAKRVYIPAIEKLKKSYKVQISLGVELKSKQNDVEEYLKANRLSFPVLYIDPFETESSIPNNISHQLKEIIRRELIDGVIIATEPKAHYCYALWALKQGLNILLDKPITTHTNVVNDNSQAEKLVTDLKKLEVAYRKLQKTKKTIFSINVQRRFHPGIQKVIELIREVAEKYNVPVTSIQSTHADGQWYFPNEIIERKYHPLNEGYGKCSHSGYHFFDIVSLFYKAGLKDKSKSGDTAEIYSSFIQPGGWIKNITENDYLSYFGKEYLSYTNHKTQKELEESSINYGELDAMSVIRIKNGNDAVCNISINLLHNSFSRRYWLQQGEDLYKGNGRVKHEHHMIQQGPFQSIHVHSYQSRDNHSKKSKNCYSLGGNNHFEIHVFRNPSKFSLIRQEDNLSCVTRYSTKDISGMGNLMKGQLVHEEVKHLVVREFIEFIEGKVGRDEIQSNIDSHSMPVSIMSAVYKSHILGMKNKNPIVNIKLN